MKPHNLLKNIALSSCNQILKIVLPLISSPYVARVLGVDGIGIYSYTYSISVYFALFAALGTEAYGLREIARSRDNLAVRSQKFWEITLLKILTSTVCIIGWIIWTLLNNEYKVYFFMYTFSLFSVMWDISWLFSGLEEFKYSMLINMLFRVLGTVSIFVFVNNQNDLWKYILIIVLSSFLASISMWVYVPKFITRVDWKSLKIFHHLKETIVYFIPAIAVSIYTVLDKTLIGLITNEPSENGNYEQANKIIGIATSVSFSGLNTVIQSRVSYLFGENRIFEVKKHIHNSMDYLLFMGMGSAFGLIAVSERFVPLYFGDGYDETIILMKLLAPLIIITGISNCIGSQYYNPAGLRSKSAKFLIIGATINLVLNLCMIPSLKSIGATLATLVAESTISFLYIINCNHYYTFIQLMNQSWKKIISASTMLIIIKFVGNVIENDIVALVSQVIVGIFVYMIILTILKDSFVIESLYPKLKGIVKKRRREKNVTNNDKI